MQPFIYSNDGLVEPLLKLGMDELHHIIYVELTTHPSLNSSPPNATYMRQWIGSALVQIMACRLDGAKPLSELMRHIVQ